MKKQGLPRILLPLMRSELATQRSASAVFGRSPAAEQAELRCVAGSWINSDGSKGLSNFECAACIEAVSHWHKDMAVRVKEELFFASRWILQLGLRVIEGTVRDSTDTDCANYVAQLTASAPQTVRQFMSTDCSSTQSMCLASSSSSPGLVLEDCSEGENQQLLDANEVSQLFVQRYKKEVGSDEAVNGDASPSDFKGLQLTTSCGSNLVVRAFHFGQGDASEPTLGLSKICTVADLMSSELQEYSLHLRVAIQNQLYRSCLQYGSYDDDGDVYNAIDTAGPCLGPSNQLFHFRYDPTCQEDYSSCYDASKNTDADIEYIFRLYTAEVSSDSNHEVISRVPSEEFNGKFGYEEAQHVIIYRDDFLPRYLVQTEQFELAGTYGWCDNGCSPSLWDFQQNTYTWTILGTLGLVDLQIDCQAQHVIQDLKKEPVEPGDVEGEAQYKADTIQWKCARVVGLGACVEKVSLELSELDELQALRFMGVDCGEGYAMQALKCEQDVKSQAIRFRATCCQLMSLPVTMTPGDIRDEDLAVEDGIYCPVGLDSSGRPSFSQELSFKWSEASASGTLTYDRGAGAWCLATTSGSGDPSCV